MVAYVPPIFFSNFVVPICKIQIAKSIAKVNVINTDEKPVARPDNNTNVLNIIPQLRGDDITQSVNFLYHV